MQVLHVTTNDPAVEAILGISQTTTIPEMESPHKYEPAIEQRESVPGYFGAIKRRETFQLIVCKVISYETQYGTKYIVIFQSREGKRAVWFASKEPKWAYDAEGCWANVKATPKAHDDHETYGNQTILLRVNDETK